MINIGRPFGTDDEGKRRAPQRSSKEYSCGCSKKKENNERIETITTKTKNLLRQEHLQISVVVENNFSIQ